MPIIYIVMALFLYPLLLLVTGCGGAVLAAVNGDGKEYTTGVITAQSNKHKTREEALEDIRRAAGIYCSGRGGGYEFIDKGPKWDPTTSTPVTRYGKCESIREKGVNSCDRYSVEDGYILKDEISDTCQVMYGCKEITRTFQSGEVSGSQRFRCFRK